MVSALSLEIREADRIRFYLNKPREQIMPADLNSDIDITPYIAQSIADEEIPIIEVGR